MASVSLEEVSKRFGQVTGVDRLNLEVKDKEFLVLVGPSGCGKSTTLRMIAGLEAVSEGRIYIGDRLVNDVPPKDRDIAMVFQSYALYPHMTVFDNMAFGLRMRGVPRAEIQRRLKEVAESLSLGELLSRKPKQLSGGQRQRVALGRAIVRDPKVFLLDEPLSNLDVQLRVTTRAEIARLHRTLRAPMIYVTHDQEEAMTLGDRIAVLRAGRCLQIGAPRDIYSRPATQFVAGFVGSPRMNLIPGALVEDAGHARLDVLGASIRSRADGVEPHALRPVQVGIRPEDLGIETVGRADFRARVDLVEPLGRESLVHLMADADAGELELRALTPETPGLEVGAVVGIRLRRDRLHVFDA